MDAQNLLLKSTRIGIGYGSQSDSFQSGREAAQLATSQLQETDEALVLAFGPASNRFKDFVEGVRLVLGEKALLGIPVEQVFTSEFGSIRNGLVIIIQSETFRTNLASASIRPHEAWPCSTRFHTEIRNQRASSSHRKKQGGYVVFHNEPENGDSLPTILAADAGLSSWFLAIKPQNETGGPLLCRNHYTDHGVAGLEMLSDRPIGLGVVTTKAFPEQPQVYLEAIKASVNEGLKQSGTNTPALVLLAGDFPADFSTEGTTHPAIKDLSARLGSAPLVGISANLVSGKPQGGQLIGDRRTVAALVLPQ